MGKEVSLDDAIGDNVTALKAPTTRETASRTSSSTAGRRRTRPTNPVKLTIELSPEQHRELKRFALLEAEDASLADVIRAAVDVLNDPKVAKAVKAQIKSSK